MRCELNQNGSFQTQEESEAKWNKTTLTYSIISGTNDIARLRSTLNLAMTIWDIEIPITLKYVKENSVIGISISQIVIAKFNVDLNLAMSFVPLIIE